MTTDEKANIILNVIQSLESLKENDVIQDFSIDWDEENNILHIIGLPKKVVEYININFTITPSGTTFQ
jgi:hypothetical protein